MFKCSCSNKNKLLHFKNSLYSYSVLSKHPFVVIRSTPMNTASATRPPIFNISNAQAPNEKKNRKTHTNDTKCRARVRRVRLSCMRFSVALLAFVRPASIQERENLHNWNVHTDSSGGRQRSERIANEKRMQTTT